MFAEHMQRRKYLSAHINSICVSGVCGGTPCTKCTFEHVPDKFRLRWPINISGGPHGRARGGSDARWPRWDCQNIGNHGVCTRLGRHHVSEKIPENVPNYAISPPRYPSAESPLDGPKRWFWVVSVVVWGPPRTPPGIWNNFGEFYFWPHSTISGPQKGPGRRPWFSPSLSSHPHSPLTLTLALLSAALHFGVCSSTRVNILVDALYVPKRFGVPSV
jgi:hypothetical protein